MYCERVFCGDENVEKLEARPARRTRRYEKT